MPQRSSRLQVLLESPATPVSVGARGGAVLVHGSCRSSGAAVAGIRLAVDGAAGSTRASRSGSRFWGVVPIYPPTRSAEADLLVEATLEDGTELSRAAGKVVVREAPPSRRPPADGGRRVAVCMATYEPRRALFERQVESIRSQSHDDWICLISDDRSRPATFDWIRGVVADDPRFVVSRSAQRLGFYMNYERVLAMVPAETGFVALADQDDRWYPDKLEILVAQIGDSILAYSDARIVTPDGSVRANTYWTHRRNNFTDLASMAFANTVTGAAALFRRELLDLALPFPPAYGRFFHDHWLAFAALASGELTYVDRPLYDYVQHRRAALGHDRAHAWALRARPRRERIRHFISDPEYFFDHWRATYFLEYCRVLLFAKVVELRCADRLTAAKRRVIRRLLAGERSPRTPAWLAARALRGLLGRNETLGSEGRALRGLAWRYLLWLSSRRAERAPRWLPRDARLPAFDPTRRRTAP